MYVDVSVLHLQFYSFDKIVPKGYYFGKHHSAGYIEYAMAQANQTEHDTISFGLQTLSVSAKIFRLESDSSSYSLEYEIVRAFFWHWDFN